MRKKGFIAVVLTTFVLGSSVLPLQADELSDLRNKQQQLEQKEQKARGELKQLTNTADKLEQLIKDLASQISVAKANLEKKEIAYNKAVQEVTIAEEKLREKEKELEERRGVLRERVRAIYIEGQVSYLEIILASEDFGDFITRLEYFNRIVDSDQRILADINQKKQEVEKKKEELIVQRDHAAKLKGEAAQAKADLDRKNSDYKVALNNNKKAQDDIFEQIDQMEADSNALAEKIRKLTAKSSGKVHGTISTYPLPGYYNVSSSYGWRIHPVTGKKSLHTGTDLPAPTGTKVIAAGAGEVILAGWYGAYGNAVIVDHGGGYTTLYGHNSSLNVSVGDMVTAGQTVSYVGSTGWSTGAHLHFEVRVNGNTTDPMAFF